MNPFVVFIASPAGRILRLVMGAACIGLGLFVVGGKTGTGLAIFGLLPISAGTFDFCPLAPIAGYPLSGAAIRAMR